jgi:inner membrane protein
LLIGGLLWSFRAEKRGENWRRSAQIAATVVGIYIFANGIITGVAERQGRDLVAQHLPVQSSMMVASPVPFSFWNRELLWRYEVPDKQGGGVLMGKGDFHLVDGAKLRIDPHHDYNPTLYLTKSSANVPGLSDRLPMYQGNDLATAQRIAKSNSEFQAFLLWSRMPIINMTRDTIMVTDQRFTDPRAIDRFTVRSRLEPDQ